MSQRSCSDRSGGFTLLEMLLAVTILGIVLMTVYGALSRTLFSKQVAEERAEMFSLGRQAVMKMGDDIEGAMLPGTGDRIFFRGSSGAGGEPSVVFIAMNRGGYGRNQVRKGQVWIEYWLEPLEGYRGLFELYRREYHYKTLLARSDGVDMDDGDDDSESEEMTVPILDCFGGPDNNELPGSCARVTGLTFRFWDDAFNQMREEWDSFEEDGATEGRLPAAVEIILVLADERGLEHDFATVVDLPLARANPTPGEIEEDDDDDDDDS